uniref:T9SS type A sorting domain-containing protein n=1 Tax=candidate division WOR-3 bacterium TaxID=2052148 RepID=A0A7V3RIA2_UNCW3
MVDGTPPSDCVSLLDSIMMIFVALPSGVYFITLEGEGFKKTEKVILLR